MMAKTQGDGIKITDWLLEIGFKDISQGDWSIKP
jgi:hypothetical protein